MWLPVPGWEGFYEVSDAGEVRSLTRVIETVRGPRRLCGREVKASLNARGYPQVGLCRDGTITSVEVHRLTARAFFGPCPPGHEVRHLDGDPTNRSLSNLRYGTPEENQADKLAHGRNRNAAKDRCPREHLLVEPNLRAKELSKGQRSCLSCARASALISLRKRRGADVPDFHELADQYYAKLGLAA